MYVNIWEALDNSAFSTSPSSSYLLKLLLAVKYGLELRDEYFSQNEQSK